MSGMLRKVSIHTSQIVLRNLFWEVRSVPTMMPSTRASAKEVSIRATVQPAPPKMYDHQGSSESSAGSNREFRSKLRAIFNFPLFMCGSPCEGQGLPQPREMNFQKDRGISTLAPLRPAPA